jgi:hypothetical protein
MKPLRHNLGRGVASRQRPAAPGVNQPLGPPSRTIQAQAQATIPATTTTTAAPSHQAPEDNLQISSSGSVGIGMGSVVRIPIPGTNGLAIELSPPKNWKGKSTSSLFFQSLDGKRILRLDYGPNKQTGKIDYHWNQSGTKELFKIDDHTPVGKAGEALYKSAKYFKYAGRSLIVFGVISDAYSIVVAKKRVRKVAQVATGWVGAWAGCKVGGAAGGAAAGAVGSVVPVAGTAAGLAVGAFMGCVVGGVGGYYYSSEAAGKAYDWVEETYFERVPEESAPR